MVTEAAARRPIHPGDHTNANPSDNDGDRLSDRQEARIRARLIEARQPLPRSQKKFKSGTTGFMLVMHVGAVFALLPMFWSWQAVVAMAVLYWVTVLGVTLGLHRLISHRSFVVPRWLVAAVLLAVFLAAALTFGLTLYARMTPQRKRRGISAA